MTRVTRLIHNAGKYLLISIYPLPTHPTHNFTHKNGGNLDTLPGWPKKLHLNRPARCAGQSLIYGNNTCMEVIMVIFKDLADYVIQISQGIMRLFTGIGAIVHLPTCQWREQPWRAMVNSSCKFAKKLRYDHKTKLKVTCLSWDILWVDGVILIITLGLP